MKNNTRKIVVLDRLNSARIEQAIFILRDAHDISESDAVSEAERIVNNYLDSLSEPLLHDEKKKHSDIRFVLLMVLYTLSTVVATAYLVTNFGI